MGKTFLLKALYASIKTIEQYKRGQNIRSDKEILSEKLYWTFQPSALGDIVKKGYSTFSLQLISDQDEQFGFSFGPSTTKQIQNLTNTFAPRTTDNSIFIPAKDPSEEDAYSNILI